MNQLRLGVLGSGKGSNFVAIQKAILQQDLPAIIQVVISDHANAGILQYARDYGLPTWALPHSRYKTKLEPDLETQLVSLFQQHEVEWVVLAGYMRVVKTPLLRAYPNRILNIHPSLLPQFKGLSAWTQALQAGAVETGCTVHLVNEEVDGGRTLAQAKVPIYPDDTPESLHARIQIEEHRLYPAVLRQISDGVLTQILNK